MSRPQADIQVQIATRAQNLPTVAQFKRWARAAAGPRAEITIRIVPLSAGQSLNRDYRGKDYATNVLSFAYEAGRVIRGDLVLCAGVVSREARAQGKSTDAHYAHLTVHGVLHLRGYDHESDAEARRMEAREKRILQTLGYPDPYQ